MDVQEKSTQTDGIGSWSNQVLDLKRKGILNFVSSLLLPLALGIFTIVITFEQQKAAKQQRDEDRHASELQRQQEKILSDETHQNAILNTYIMDMAELLDRKSGSLTFDKVTATVSRAKTLNTFRELDPQRIVRVIRFLHEVGQLNHSPIDLSTAELHHVDFRELGINRKQLSNISLTGMFFSDAILTEIEMDNINFFNTHFVNVTFAFSGLKMVNFSSSKFYQANFVLSRHECIDFSSSRLETTNFTLSRLESNTTFTFATVNNSDFSNTQLIDVRFTAAEIDETIFRSSFLSRLKIENSQLFRSNFISSTFIDGLFSSTRFDHVILQHVTFKYVVCLAVSMHYVDFSSTKIDYTNFTSAIIRFTDFSSAFFAHVQFKSSMLDEVSFSSAELGDTVFTNCILDSANFIRATLFNTNFENTSLIKADFSYANLTNSSFKNSNLKHAIFEEADLTHVNFSGANLYKTNLIGTNISDHQLHSALSIQDAILPNGTRSHNENLLKNGQANCHVSLGDTWQLEGDDITIEISKNNSQTRMNCQFTLRPLSREGYIRQRINLSERWDSNAWPYSQVILSASMNTGVSIHLKGINNHGMVVAQQNLSSNTNNVSLALHHDMKELEVIVEFTRERSQILTNLWCDDIELYIIYGTYSEFPQIVTHIPSNTEWKVNAMTVAGGNGYGNGMNQLSGPRGLYVDDDQTIYIADQLNHRIMEWKLGKRNGRIVAGGNGQGNGAHQLDRPYDVVVDQKYNDLIICSWGNRRIVRWSRQNGTHGEIMLSNIYCGGLAIDDNGSLYVADWFQQAIRRYQPGDTKGTIVAGGNGQGNRLDQFSSPWFVFIDHDYSIYVGDRVNNRVMKWTVGSKQGIIVAGGQGQGSQLSQFHSPLAVLVDQRGTVYVSDRGNARIMRWSEEATYGNIVAGGNQQGAQSNQFNEPWDISFDRHGNLYVVDYGNNRVQKFNIETKN